MSQTPEVLAHQFDDLEQQHDAANLGMWAFLATEILFFGGMFLGYAVYRSLYPEAFIAASNHMDILLGMINTVVLIASSLTVVLAVHAAQHDRRRLWWVLMLTIILLGLVFLGINPKNNWHKSRKLGRESIRISGKPAQAALSSLLLRHDGSMHEHDHRHAIFAC